MNKSNSDSISFKAGLFGIASSKVLTQAVLGAAIPYISLEFSNVENITLLSKMLLTVPSLFIVLFSPLAGYLMDKYGRLKFIYPALILWTISGSIGYFLNDIYSLLVSRAIFGISTAFTMTGAFTLIEDYYGRDAGNKRDKILSELGVFMGFSGIVFGLGGGLLGEIGWRYVFLIHMIGAIIFLVSVIRLHEPQIKIAHNNVEIIRSSLVKLIPIFFTSFYCIMLYFTMPTNLPFYIINVLEKSPKYIGFMTVISFTSFGVASFLYTYIRRLGTHKTWFLAYILMGIGFCNIYFTNSYTYTLMSVVLIGGSGGLMVANGASWLFMKTDKRVRAKAYGILASCIYLGQFLSPFLTQPIVIAYGVNFIFIVVGAIFVLSSSVFLFLKEPVENID